MVDVKAGQLATRNTYLIGCVIELMQAWSYCWNFCWFQNSV